MRKLLPVCILLFEVGCAGGPRLLQTPNKDKEWNVPEVNYVLPPATDGGLYRQGYSLSLFQDKKAFRVGDILTISLNEKTYSSKKANTETEKENGLDLGLNASANNWDVSGNGESKIGRNFSGSGSSMQQNQLSGSITVTVAKVLPNGTLFVKGEKWLSTNEGDEFLRLKGIVRTEDINNDNMISSQRIANAQIVYGGQGAIADSNVSGWATRFFNSPWFPL